MKNKFFLKLITLMAFALPLSRPAQAGPIIVGGAGESEYSVIFARDHLRELLETCLQITCSLNEKQISLLQNLVSISDQAPTPVFKSASDMTELFELHGNHVWILRDRLWEDPERTVSLKVGGAVGLWIQILGTIAQIPSDQVADLTPVASKATDHGIQRAKIDLQGGQSFEFVLWDQGSPTRFLIRDPGLQSLNLMALLTPQALRCPGAVKDLRIYSPAWQTLSGAPDPLRAQISLQFGISWTCGDFQISTNAVFYSTAVRPSESEPFQLDPAAGGILVNPGVQ